MLFDGCVLGLAWPADKRGKESDGEADREGSLGVGGHRGLLWSTIGAEISSRFAIEDPREEVRDPRVLPLSESVSLVHENDRELRVVCALLSGDPGGVTSPRGRRASASLRERLSFTIASSPSIVAQAVMIAFASHRGKEEKLLTVYLLLCSLSRVNGIHGEESRAVTVCAVALHIHSVLGMGFTTACTGSII